MEKKKWVKLAGFAMVFLLSLFLCVGCAENSAEDSDEVTFIDFSRESASSRGIESWNENLYPPESLYWTYKATKIRGNYTTGQTNGEEKAVVKNGPATGLGTVGPFSVGVWKFELFGYLSCAEDPDTGELEFSDLVYTGMTGTETDNYITIDKRPEGVTTVQQIIFELSATSFWDSLQGQLAINNLKLTVPEGQRISGTKPVSGKTGAEIVIKIWEGTPSGTNLPIAESVSVIDDDVNGGTALVDADGVSRLVTPTFIDYSGTIYNKFSAETHNFYIAAMYQDEFTAKEGTASGQAYFYTGTDDENIYDNGYAPIGAIVSYPLAIKAGVKTTISGDINDIQVAEDAYAHDVKYDWAVAKVTWTSAADNPDGTGVDYSVYTTLKEAVTKYLANTDKVKEINSCKYVELLNDLYIAETLDSATLTADVPIFTNGHFIRNLTVSGTKNVILKPVVTATATAVRDYTFKSGKIVDFSSNSDTVWLCTDSDVSSSSAELTVNAPNDSVFHTGKAKNVTLTAVANTAATASAYSKGYHLGTDRDGADTVTFVKDLTVTKGRVELGGRTTVNTLTSLATTAGDVVLSGKRDAVVQSYGYGATPTVLRVFDTSTKVSSENLYASQDTAATKAGFKEILLDGNGGTTRISAGKVVASGGTECSKAYIYGIDGMYVTLENNVFKQSFVAGTPAAQEAWNLDFAGEGTYYGGSFYSKKYVTGSNTSGDKLYAWWKDNKKVLGGTVYFLRTSTVPATSGAVSEVISGNADGTVKFNNNVTYTFFDENGNPLNLSGKTYQTTWAGAWGEYAEVATHDLTIGFQKVSETTLLTSLAGAKYCTVTGKPESGYKDGVYVVNREGAIINLTYGAYGVNMGVGGNGDALWGFGQGKVISDKVMSTYKNIAVRRVGDFNTIWAYMDWMNNGTDYGTASWSGRISRVDGCTDWYIPSVVEVLQLYNCGLSVPGIKPTEYCFTAACSEHYRRVNSDGVVVWKPESIYCVAGHESAATVDGKSMANWGGMRLGYIDKNNFYSSEINAVVIRSF